jgi:hypothetical protein
MVALFVQYYGRNMFQCNYSTRYGGCCTQVCLKIYPQSLYKIADQQHKNIILLLITVNRSS